VQTFLNADWPSWTLFLNPASFKVEVENEEWTATPYSLDSTRSSSYGKMESIYGEQVSGLADTAVFSLHTKSREIVDDVSQPVFNLKNAILTAKIIEEAIAIHGFPGEWSVTIPAYSAQAYGL
jgi:hypothetical protein